LCKIFDFSLSSNTLYFECAKKKILEKEGESADKFLIGLLVLLEEKRVIITNAWRRSLVKLSQLLSPLVPGFYDF